MHKTIRTCVLLWLILSPRLFAADLVVRYPDINGLGTAGLGYHALELALLKSGGAYSPALKLGDNTANNDRIRHLLERGEVDVADFGTSPEYEQRFSAVYFPIDRGLNGWRLLLVRKEYQRQLEAVQSLAQLAHFTAGQGQGWPDADILKAAGLPVITVPMLQNLFPMLAAGRFDYVPLGMNEIYGLVDKYGSSVPGLAVDRHLVLVYPFGRLFFVRKGNDKLRDAILTGLQRAFEDGSYEKMLMADPDYAKAIADPDFRSRIALHLDNPALTPEFRAIPDQYFFR